MPANDDKDVTVTDQDIATHESKEIAMSVEIVIDRFLHRVLDIEDCARDFIEIAYKKYNKNADRLKSSITKCQKTLKNEEDQDKRLLCIKHIRKSIREIDRHNNSSPVSTLEKSLFIYLFAAFDKFIGDLVTALYHSNPELYKNINKEIPLSEALQYETMNDLREIMLGKEVETLRRKGYIDQFKDLENKFSIKLSKFDEWPYFIECAQRRNLFTHCDGIASKQYLDICKDIGVKSKNPPQIGDQLKISGIYFFQSCNLVTKVAVMLGHTLWRKIQPSELEKADSHLSSLIFNFLHREDWAKSISLSKFALGLPKISTEEMDRIFTINYAIALKAANKIKTARNVLDKKDWSATTYDFKLAYAVLTDNYPDARKFMQKMGPNGELISELAYHDWPLFSNFRDSEEFLEGYLAVYGYKYSSKLSSLAEEKKTEVENTSAEEVPS